MRRAWAWGLALALAWTGTALAETPEAPPGQGPPPAIRQAPPQPGVRQQMKDMKRGGSGRVLRSNAPASGGQGLKPPPELQRRALKGQGPGGQAGQTPPPGSGENR